MILIKKVFEEKDILYLTGLLTVNDIFGIKYVKNPVTHIQ